jgi:hypothetical protein
MKYSVTLYQEKYTEFEIEADSQEDAEEKVLSGEFDDDDIVDVNVKYRALL